MHNSARMWTPMHALTYAITANENKHKHQAYEHSKAPNGYMKIQKQILFSDSFAFAKEVVMH